MGATACSDCQRAPAAAEACKGVPAPTPTWASPSGPDDAVARIEWLEHELRLLKDDNYRIREDQLRFRQDATSRRRSPGRESSAAEVCPQRSSGRGSAKGLSADLPQTPKSAWSANAVGQSSQPWSGRAASPRASPPRIVISDVDQQLSHMRDMVKSLQAENSQLRATVHRSSDLSSGGATARYQLLEDRIGELQQAQLQPSRDSRQFSGHSPAAAVVDLPAFGIREDGAGNCESAGSLRELQQQYEALSHEHASLRGKVRRLAHMS